MEKMQEIDAELIFPMIASLNRMYGDITQELRSLCRHLIYENRSKGTKSTLLLLYSIYQECNDNEYFPEPFRMPCLVSTQKQTKVL